MMLRWEVAPAVPLLKEAFMSYERLSPSLLPHAAQLLTICSYYLGKEPEHNVVETIPPENRMHQLQSLAHLAACFQTADLRSYGNSLNRQFAIKFTLCDTHNVVIDVVDIFLCDHVTTAIFLLFEKVCKWLICARKSVF